MKLFGITLPRRVPRSAQPYLVAGAIIVSAGAGVYALWALKGTSLATTLMRRVPRLRRSAEDDSPDSGPVRLP